MSIQLGIVLYGLCVLFFCALTRANEPERAELFTDPPRAGERFEPRPSRSAVHAQQGHD